MAAPLPTIAAMTDQPETVARITTATGTISITRDRAGGVLRYELEGWGQSSADNKGTSLASYIHAIFGLLHQTRAQDILLIGCAGGTLATMLARAGRAPVLVDIDPVSFDLARTHFHLPDSVPCHAADGEAFLRDTKRAWDAIVLDAFVGKEIPPHLQTPDFFALARGRLTPGGAIFANVHVKHDFDDTADLVAKAMKTAFAEVRLLDALGVIDRSAIVMAGGVEALRPPRLVAKPRVQADRIAKELSRLDFRPWKAARWDFGR